MSAEKAIDIAKSIYSIKVVTPLNKEQITKVLLLNGEQKIGLNYSVFELDVPALKSVERTFGFRPHR